MMLEAVVDVTTMHNTTQIANALTLMKVEVEQLASPATTGATTGATTTQ